MRQLEIKALNIIDARCNHEADTMLTATHSAGSVVPKATIATARGATMHIAVPGLFYAIYEERIEGDKK